MGEVWEEVDWGRGRDACGRVGKGGFRLREEARPARGFWGGVAVAEVEVRRKT